jgi:effector-binding domain-containing protein
MESIDYSEERKVAEIFSKTIRAGKRTYFFDVKSTRNNEYYLTITESKKKFADDGNYRYEKHKLFLYPEDFEKFSETFEEIISYIRENQPTLISDALVESDAEKPLTDENFTSVEFEDI